MTLTEQVAQLRELAPLSSGTRMLDVLIINVLDQLAQAVDRLDLERNQPQGQTRSRSLLSKALSSWWDGVIDCGRARGMSDPKRRCSRCKPATLDG
jgi:hypothetical protein